MTAETEPTYKNQSRVERRFPTADQTVELRPRYFKSIRSNQRFRTAVVAADRNRIIKLDLSGLKRRFQFNGQAADQTVESPKLMKPKGKAKGILHRRSSR